MNTSWKTYAPAEGASLARYYERTDRNIGWLTPEEQQILRVSTVGIAGCGGMGGLVAAIMVRLGVGEVRIADSETFDFSNLNRQFAARQSTIGVSKAAATADELRAISDDMTLHVHTAGITKESVAQFADGCDLICDEIEFWAASARIILHQEARRRGIPLFTCTSVGFGTRLLYFAPGSAHIEDLLGMTASEAETLEERIRAKTATPAEVERVLGATMTTIVPELPRYTSFEEAYDDREACMTRMRHGQHASILASNPPLAAGFLANYVLLMLLSRKSDVRRTSLEPPLAPGYLYLDAAFMQAKRVESGSR